MVDRLRRAFDGARRSSEDRDVIHGRMGKLNADGTFTVKVAARPGYAYVRLGSYGEQTVAIALNLGTPYQADRPVKMTRRDSLGGLVISGTNEALMEQFAGGSAFLGDTSPHTHQIGTGQEYEIEANSFEPGRVIWDQGLQVYINPFRYYFRGVWDTWSGGLIYLASYLPATSDFWAWVLVGIDPVTNTAVAVTGTEYPVETPLSIEFIDDIDFSYFIPCNAIKIRENDTTLSDNDDYQDASGWFNQHVDELNSVPDVDIVDVADRDVLGYNNADSEWQNFTPFTYDDIVFSVPIEKNQRNNEEDFYGTLHELDVGNTTPLNSGSDIDIIAGAGKLIIVIHAGSDFAGDITFTGDTVDRSTGVVTEDNVEVITIAALSTDDTDTDIEGNKRYSFNGYITANWFQGDVTISTLDVTLTDVDTYQCSFEQINDLPNVELKSFDYKGAVTNDAAWFYGYCYTLQVTGSRVEFTRTYSLELDAADTLANKPYRRRKDDNPTMLDGRTDGLLMKLYFGPIASTYHEDVTVTAWCTIQKTLQLKTPVWRLGSSKLGIGTILG